jgi:hypothetical protein
MTWVNIPLTFTKIKKYLNFFGVYLCFEYTSTLYSFSQIYYNFPFYKVKWNNLFYNFLHRLYYNIIWKNIVKFFQEFEVGYTQTCTSLESSIMWHPKGGHCNVLSPPKEYNNYHLIVLSTISDKSPRNKSCFDVMKNNDTKFGNHELMNRLVLNFQSNWKKILNVFGRHLIYPWLYHSYKRGRI